MAYNTLLFDLDGTLLDTLDDLEYSVNQVLLKHNFPKRSKSEIRVFLGNGGMELMRLAVPKPCSQEEILLYFNDFQQIYNKNMDNSTKPFEGIIDLLYILKDKGYKLAIVSNKYDLAVKELSQKYFKDIFPVAIGESSKIKRKPAPDILLAAMEELNSLPNNSILIGDSETDVQTAKNCNIPCIGVTWGFRDRKILEESGADYIIDEIKEILDII